jgi:hypothetical protein
MKNKKPKISNSLSITDIEDKSRKNLQDLLTKFMGGKMNKSDLASMIMERERQQQQTIIAGPDTDNSGDKIKIKSMNKINIKLTNCKFQVTNM